MGFWSSFGNGIKKAATSALNFVTSVVKSTWDYISAPVANIWGWLKNKTKRLVNSFTEWKDNALNLLKQRYPGWLAVSILAAGLLLLKFAVIPVVVGVVVVGVLWFLLDTLFVNADNGATDDQQAAKIAQTLKEQADQAMERGEYQAAYELYEQAMETTKCHADKEEIKGKFNYVSKVLSNINAEKLYDEGCEAFKRGNLKAARDKFAEAVNKCTEDYEGRTKFTDNWNQVKSKMFYEEGLESFNARNFEQAIEKFDDAIRHRDESNYHDKKSECFFELANKFYASQNLEKAKEFYQKAIAECSYGYSGEEKFQEGLKTVFNDIRNQEAEKLNKEGLEAFKLSDFKAAKDKFSQAISHCSSNYKSKKNFEENFSHTQAEILNLEADKLYKSGNYHKAVEKYREAIATIPASKTTDVNKYKNQLSSTLNSIGCLHMEKEEFEEAKKIFLIAVKESGENNKNLAKLMENLKNAEDGMKNQSAEKVFHEGLIAFEEKNFKAAQEKFSQAVKHCTENYKNRTLFENNLHRSHAALLNIDGVNFHAQNKFREAVEKFREAIAALPDIYGEDLIEFKNNLCNSHNEVGLAAWHDKNFIKSQENFEEAIKSCVEKNKSDILKEQLDHSIAAVLNQEGEKLFKAENFTEAIEKFKKSLKINPKSEKCDSTIFNAAENEKIHRKNLATTYNQFGLQLLENLKFDDAKFNFILAIDETLESDNEKLEVFRSNLKKAEIAILNRDIEELNQSGQNELDAGNFEAALEIFKQAEEKCSHNYCNKQKITDSKNFVAASIFHRDGLKALKMKNFSHAVEKITKALEILPANKNDEKKIFMKHIAEAYNAQGDFMASQNCFQIALNNYRKAVQMDESEIYENNRKMAESEVLNEAGMNFVKFNKFEQAAEKFQQAMTIAESVVGSVKKSFAKNPATALEEFAKSLIANGKAADAVETFNLALKFASENQIEAIKFERNSAKLDILKNEYEKLYKDQKLEEAIEMIDEAIEIATSEELKSSLEAKKLEILEDITEKLLNEKKYEKAVEKIEQSKKLNLSNENSDEKIAAINILKTIENIQDLSPEVVVRRLTKDLKVFKNFKNLEFSSIQLILNVFLNYDAIEQAQEFIEKNSSENRKKLEKIFDDAIKEKQERLEKFQMIKYFGRKAKKESQLIMNH